MDLLEEGIKCLVLALLNKPEVNFPFILYTSPVGNIIRRHNICFHCYPDDIQLYAAFDHKIPGDCEQAMERITWCISDINRWMLRNNLQLNQDKPEFFVVASPRVLN